MRFYLSVSSTPGQKCAASWHLQQQSDNLAASEVQIRLTKLIIFIIWLNHLKSWHPQLKGDLPIGSTDEILILNKKKDEKDIWYTRKCIFVNFLICSYIRKLLFKVTVENLIRSILIFTFTLSLKILQSYLY